MKVSILVCTYNRAPFLDKLLESLVKQEFEGEHEIIIVDNNSNDETRAAAEKWIPLANPRCPIRYIFVARQGVSYARNVGAEAATGDVIALIDDDATAETRWLQRIVDNMDDQTIACVSGKVLPDWSETPPKWMTFELWPYVGGSIHGDVRRSLTGKLSPMGGNMAVRKDWYTKVGGFDVRMGRVGRNLASYADIEFAARMRCCGAVMVYDPLMIIHHYVPQSRMTRDFLLQRSYWDGRSVSQWEYIRGGMIRQWAIGILRLMVTIPRDLLGLLVHSTVGDHSRRFTYLCRLKRTQGYVHEMWQGLPIG